MQVFARLYKHFPQPSLCRDPRAASLRLAKRHNARGSPPLAWLDLLLLKTRSLPSVVGLCPSEEASRRPLHFTSHLSWEGLGALFSHFFALGHVLGASWALLGRFYAFVNDLF